MTIIDALAEAYAASTPGEWRVNGIDTASYIELRGPKTLISVTSRYLMVKNPNAGNDARFQALAHNTTPALLVLYRAAEDRLSYMHDQDDPCNDKLRDAVRALREMKP